ncbi:MAG TPA: SCP2 sterol-binding domain-containing protein [Thermodesulfobacteriota bacterium]|nr:SCP2 sterol-binding domain-containing protein [Thermodesulfobacteriota bacterium]
MKPKLSTILLITSFVPVIVFKVVARIGDATLSQAKVATVAGLILAGTQLILSKKVFKRTTYLERAFLGFLGFGTIWVYVAPAGVASLFVDHSTTLLYFVLFLTTFVPQLFGYDPFTYAIAKQMTPERVWNSPHFRRVNLHLTYFWSVIFFTNSLLSWLGHGKPFFSILVPFIIILGIGLPAVKIYPKYYLKRKFAAPSIDPSLIPDTAKELISRMPLGFRQEAAGNLKAEIQFDLSGEGGVKGVLSVSEGRCSFREGDSFSPSLTIRSPAHVWMKIARQEINRAQALMDGLYDVKGDMNLLMKMGDLFRLPGKTAGDDLTKKGERKMTKILAIQGSPRPKASNTEILLQEFLKGAQTQGAETETIYLKEKEIHSCVGCYTCWAKTPGVCVFKDDMPELLEKVKGCDILVYATPLYNFNVTALLKAFQERLLPLLDPHLIKTGEVYRHPQRYAVNRKMVLISTCGFPEISHFDGFRQVFRHLERNGGAPIIGELLMPGGELLKQKGMEDNVQGVLQTAYRAGVEVIRDGKVSKETEAKIQKPLVPPDELAEMANLWWDSLLEGITLGKPVQGKVEDMRLLLRGMAASFNSKAAGDLKATIQFEVTGRQTGNWFLSIDTGKCTFHEGKVNSPSLTIKTPSEVWLAIANKEMDGQQAFMEGKYTGTGDMSLLMRMKTLFGSAAS